MKDTEYNKDKKKKRERYQDINNNCLQKLEKY